MEKFDVVDGIADLDQVVAKLGREKSATIAWDIDGTLFDPHPRMVETVRAFGHPDVDPKLVERSWQETATNLGINPDDFYKFWNAYYWDPINFFHDAPIEKTMERLREAQSQGIRNMIITGRHSGFERVTVDQLKEHDIDVDVITKPPGILTPKFKADTLRKQIDSGEGVDAFVSDCIHEVRAIQQITPEDHVDDVDVFYCVPGDHVTVDPDTIDHPVLTQIRADNR